MQKSEVEIFKKSSKYGIYLRFVLKILSMIVDIFYIRKIPSNLLGLSNIRLGLLYSTVVSLCRDPFRKALISEHHSALLTIISFLCPFIGLLVGAVLFLIWILFLTPSTSVISFSSYFICSMIYVIGSILELLVEPAFLYLKTSDCVLSLTGIEVFSQIFHTFILMVIINVYSSITIYMITFLHICRIGVLLFSHWIVAWYQNPSFLPKLSTWKNTWSQIYYNDKISLIVSFAKQNILQQLLSQGENYMINMLPWMNLSDQGYYSIVFNLGSIIPHVIFAPIEEAFYILCGRKLTRVSNSANDRNSFLVNIYWPTQRLMLYFGIISAIYSQLYSNTFFVIFFKHGIHSLNTLIFYMRLFGIYVFFLALNGISEGLTYSTLNQAEVSSRSRLLIVISLAYFITLAMTTYFIGVPGLIVANIVSCIVRIFLSFSYIKKYFKLSLLDIIKNLTPSRQILGVLFVNFILINKLSKVLHGYSSSEFFIHSTLILAGLVSMLANILTTYKYDKQLKLILIKDILQQKTHQ